MLVIVRRPQTAKLWGRRGNLISRLIIAMYRHHAGNPRNEYCRLRHRDQEAICTMHHQT